MNYVLGDSHVTLFSGQDLPTRGFPNETGDRLKNFVTGDASARLAYNFNQKDHQVTTAINNMISQIEPGSTVIFSFGEIDCRSHVWTQIKVWGKGLIQTVSKIVERYTSGLEHFIKQGLDVYALLPHIVKNKANIESASGTWEEITLASFLFNLQMEKWNKDRCISLFAWTFSNQIYERYEYYRDDYHLNHNALPAMLSECKLKGIEI